jgi:fatty acid desaturase
MRNFLRNYLDDILLLAGCGSILYGLSMWNPVITWIVAGIMLIGLGVMIGKVRI